ncbi:MAG: succinate dehydrogenase assembly factor 2 [Alphaproteobacteria bacterium]|jgi:antitoxin CptB
MNREIRIKKLLYQSWYRGNRETDKILGNFAKTNLTNFDNRQLDEFEQILQEQDDDIYAWVSLQLEIPKRLKNNSVLKQLIIPQKIVF